MAAIDLVEAAFERKRAERSERPGRLFVTKLIAKHPAKRAARLAARLSTEARR